MKTKNLTILATLLAFTATAQASPGAAVPDESWGYTAPAHFEGECQGASLGDGEQSLFCPAEAPVAAPACTPGQVFGTHSQYFYGDKVTFRLDYVVSCDTEARLKIVAMGYSRNDGGCTSLPDGISRATGLPCSTYSFVPALASWWEIFVPYTAVSTGNYSDVNGLPGAVRGGFLSNYFQLSQSACSNGRCTITSRTRRYMNGTWYNTSPFTSFTVQY